MCSIFTGALHTSGAEQEFMGVNEFSGKLCLVRF
jgi:hypothetical protein